MRRISRQEDCGQENERREKSSWESGCLPVPDACRLGFFGPVVALKTQLAPGDLAGRIGDADRPAAIVCHGPSVQIGQRRRPDRVRRSVGVALLRPGGVCVEMRLERLHRLPKVAVNRNQCAERSGSESWRAS